MGYMLEIKDIYKTFNAVEKTPASISELYKLISVVV